MTRPRHGLRIDYARLEDGLSSRQKDYIRELLVELVAALLQHEAQVPGSIGTYDELYRLTKDEHFLAWQEVVLSRGVREATPASTVFGLIVQLRQVDLDLQATGGYLQATRAVIATALSRLLHTANSIFVAHAGRVPMIITTDKDGNEWQMYTAAKAPDSVIVRRRVHKPKAEKQAAKKPAKRPFRPGRFRSPEPPRSTSDGDPQ